MKRALLIVLSALLLTPRGVRAEETVIIPINGAPQWVMLADQQTMKAANTDAQLFMDLTDRRYYLHHENVWYSTTRIDGSWNRDSGVPTYIRAAAPGGMQANAAAPIEPVNVVISTVSQTSVQAQVQAPTQTVVQNVQTVYVTQPQSTITVGTWAPVPYYNVGYPYYYNRAPCYPGYGYHPRPYPHVNVGVHYNPWNHHVTPHIGAGIHFGR